MASLMDMKELRSILTETIRGIKRRKIKPEQARAIYGGTSQLMGSYRLEFQYHKLRGEKLDKSKFLQITDGK